MSEKPVAYSIQGVCDATTLSRSFVKRLIAEKKLEARKVGSRVLIPAAALDRLLNGEPADAAAD